MEVSLSPEEWQRLLERLYERDDRLEFRVPGEQYAKSERVDDYVMSAHAEALISDEIDGDVWGTLEDIDEHASTEAQAWATIRAFYLSRGHVLLNLGGGEEWIFSEELAGRLGLLSAPNGP